MYRQHTKFLGGFPHRGSFQEAARIKSARRYIHPEIGGKHGHPPPPLLIPSATTADSSAQLAHSTRLLQHGLKFNHLFRKNFHIRPLPIKRTTCFRTRGYYVFASPCPSRPALATIQRIPYVVLFQKQKTAFSNNDHANREKNNITTRIFKENN